MAGDIGYSGSSSGGFNVSISLPNINFSSGVGSSNATVWEGPDWYLASTGSSTDVANVVEDLIGGDLSNVGSLTNPYPSSIVVGERWISFPNGAGFWTPIFAKNTTYTEFENQATQVQQTVYSDIYSSFESSINNTISDTLSQTSEEYSSSEFGDISTIYNLKQDILNLQKNITMLGVEDSITQDYNRIADTNNTDTISNLQSELDDLQKQYDSLTDSYNDTWTSVENSLFDNRLTSSNADNLVVTSNEKIDSLDGYTDTRFGDIESIQDLANQIEATKNDLFFKQQEQDISSEYEKVDTVDNSKDISDLQSLLDALNNDFNAATDLYDAEKANKEFQDKMKMLREQENTDPFWNPVKPSWLQDTPPPQMFPRDVYTIQMSVEERVGYINDFMNGSMNLWMAGGILYDSPRAGDTMFNVTGDMNTTKFLGIKNNNSNKWSEWNSDRYHDYQKKVFGNLAGSDFFAVNKLAQRI